MRIGEFILEERIGRGGMGDVWRAAHKNSPYEVAIKTVRGKKANDTRFIEGFEREIRAVAGLNHRGIVNIIDVGRIPENVTSDDYKPGTPWFAMELAVGALPEQLESWGQLSRLVLDVLDALAYAHARGVVHRDLKPDNILLGEDQDGYYPLLTDFGISHVVDPTMTLDPAALSSSTAGTPAFMAPEQFRGDWRRYGPWTDLYALGCVVYQLACGEAPFVAGQPFAVGMKHLQDPFPKLAPLFPVPPKFEAWLQKLVQKAINQRFQCAADAAWNLTELCRGQWVPSKSLNESESIEPRDGKSSTHFATLTYSDTQQINVSRRVEVLSSDHRGLQEESTERAPFVDWRCEEPELPTLSGVGLNLFGLRPPPFVNRETERERLWSALGDALEGGPHFMKVIGDAQVGKTRCIQWVARRAMELGIVHHAIRSGHTQSSSSDEGIPRLMRKLLPCKGMGSKEMFAFVKESLRLWGADVSIDELAASVMLLMGDEVPLSAPAIQFESPNQRHIVLARVLEFVSARRPVFVWIDDAQWGEDAVAFAALLARWRTVNAFVVVSGRAGGWEESLDAPTLQIDEVGESDFRDYLTRLIPLDEGSRNFLMHRSMGQFKAAEQLVAHWISNEELVATQDGFRVESDQLTEEFRELWENRLRDILSELPEEAAPALELAVALGGDISNEEWGSAASCLGIEIPSGLAVRMELEGLAVVFPDGWAFAKSPLVDLIKRRSQSAGRWSDVLIACANAELEDAANGVPAAQRRGTFLYDAGRFKEARQQYLLAVDELMRQTDYRASMRLLDRIREIDQTISTPSNAAESLQAQTRRVEVFRFVGQLENGDSVAKELREACATCDDKQAVANAYRAIAGLLYVRGEYQDALNLYMTAKAIFESIGDQIGLAKILHGEGWFRLNRGDREGAVECYTNSAELAELGGSDIDYAWALQGLADVWLREGNPDGLPYAMQAYEYATKAGSLSAAGMALKSIGDGFALRKQFDDAREHYQIALRSFMDCNSSLAGLVVARQAVMELRCGNNDEALRLATQALDEFGPKLALQLKLVPHLVMLHQKMGIGEVSSLNELDEILMKTNFVHPDVHWLVHQIRAADPQLGEWLDVRLRSKELDGL